MVPIKVATDEQLVIDGVATVPLRVGGRSTVTDVLVTRDITGLILGVDWMTRQGPLTWDFQNARVRFGKGEWIDLRSPVLLTTPLFNPNFGDVPVASDRRCWASTSAWTLSYSAVKLFSKNSNLCDRDT